MVEVIHCGDISAFQEHFGRLSSPFCVLLGAGISKPAGIPTAEAFVRSILASLPLRESHRRELEAAGSSDWERGVGYYDRLRFEQVVSALQVSLDPKLASLHALQDERSPGRYHQAIAELVKRGCIVVTTNFDTLTEKACKDSGAVCKTIVSTEDYERARGSTGARRRVYKVHGSVSQSSNPTELTITFRDLVSEPATGPRKWETMIELFKRYDTVVMGYSGSDDFDVMPALFFSGSKRKVFWIDHASRPSPLQGHLRWHFQRLWGQLELSSHVGQKEEDIALLQGDTLHALQALSRTTYMRGDAIEEASFLSKTKDSVTERAVRDPAGAYLLCGLLFEECGHLELANAYFKHAESLVSGAPPITAAQIHAARARVCWEMSQMSDAVAASHRCQLAVAHLKTVPLFAFHWLYRGLTLVDYVGWEKALLRKVPTGNKKQTSAIQQWALEEALMCQVAGMPDQASLDIMQATLAAANILSRYGKTEARGSISKHPILSIDRERRSDFIFLLAKATHLRGLIQDRGEMRSGQWSALSGNQMPDARNAYEILGRRRKLVQLTLYLAESYFDDGFTDWALDEATHAFAVATKINNEQALKQSEFIMSRCDRRGVRTEQREKTDTVKEAAASFRYPRDDLAIG